MTLVVNVFLAGVCLFYLWQLWATVRVPDGGASAATDRLRLLNLVLEVALVLFLARVLVTWTPATSWLWVAGFAAAGGAAALAVLRGRDLPWLAGAGRGRGRLRRVTAPLSATVLVVLDVLAYASLF